MGRKIHDQVGAHGKGGIKLTLNDNREGNNSRQKEQMLGTLMFRLSQDSA